MGYLDAKNQQLLKEKYIKHYTNDYKYGNSLDEIKRILGPHYDNAMLRGSRAEFNYDTDKYTQYATNIVQRNIKQYSEAYEAGGEAGVLKYFHETYGAVSKMNPNGDPEDYEIIKKTSEREKNLLDQSENEIKDKNIDKKYIEDFIEEKVRNEGKDTSAQSLLNTMPEAEKHRLNAIEDWNNKQKQGPISHLSEAEKAAFAEQKQLIEELKQSIKERERSYRPNVKEIKRFNGKVSGKPYTITPELEQMILDAKSAPMPEPSNPVVGKYKAYDKSQSKKKKTNKKSKAQIKAEKNKQKINDMKKEAVNLSDADKGYVQKQFKSTRHTTKGLSAAEKRAQRRAEKMMAGLRHGLPVALMAATTLLIGSSIISTMQENSTKDKAIRENMIAERKLKRQQEDDNKKNGDLGYDFETYQETVANAAKGKKIKRDPVINMLQYSNQVQNMYSNRTGHTSMGNSRFK